MQSRASTTSTANTWHCRVLMTNVATGIQSMDNVKVTASSLIKATDLVHEHAFENYSIVDSLTWS